MALRLERDAWPTVKRLRRIVACPSVRPLCLSVCLFLRHYKKTLVPISCPPTSPLLPCSPSANTQKTWVDSRQQCRQTRRKCRHVPQTIWSQPLSFSMVLPQCGQQRHLDSFQSSIRSYSSRSRSAWNIEIGVEKVKDRDREGRAGSVYSLPCLVVSFLTDLAVQTYSYRLQHEKKCTNPSAGRTSRERVFSSFQCLSESHQPPVCTSCTARSCSFFLLLC